jgi:hypothetical protein
MKYKAYILCLSVLGNNTVFAQPSSDKTSSSLQGLVFTTLIAVIGFLAKSIYELYLERRRKRIQNIEDKLKLFFWPILIRLEKDNSIWETILSKRQDPNSIQYKIANHVERNDLIKNHLEVLDIIDNYTYLAEPDEAMTEEIKKYIKNVEIYKALREAGEEKIFPIELGAVWPENFYLLIKQRTETYQNKLNKEPL